MRQFHRLSPLWQLGSVVGLSTLIPLGIGLWADHRFGTTPLLTYAGALLGIILGTIGTVRVAVRTIDALGHAPESQPGVLTETIGKEDNA